MQNEWEQAVKSWMDLDPDPKTRSTAQQLLEEGDNNKLREHFGCPLRFGTAGIRRPMGPGFNRMNRVTVRQVSAGLARFLKQKTPKPNVVVGYDGRKNSRLFAEDTAAVLADSAVQVWLFELAVPTPLLAFATLALKAEAGVMITASHNPAQDNGLKVFGMNGAQVIPPDDALIMAAIDGIAVPKTVSSFQVLCAEGMVRSVPDQVETDYLLSMERLRIHRFSGIRIAYTPLHGVGWRLVKHVLNNAGHMDLHVVTEQAEPDGDFPTVTSPNPEDEEALNRAISLAKDLDADLVLANDPDSDRLAVAVPDDQQGSWRILTGDEISSLLADYLLEHGPKEGKQLVVTNLLSSGLLEKVVESHEATYVETRVGFKWVADQAIKWQAAGGQCVLASEEALGFSAGGVVCDKDGISTALLMADLSAWCHAQGGTLLSYLERIYQRYGIYATDKSAFTMPGPEGSDRIRYILDDLRRNPLEEVAGIQVTRISDRIAGSNTIGFFLYDGSRILARASGSEPKVKFYFRVHELPAHKPLADLEVRAKQRLIRLKNALLERVGLEIEGTIHGK